MWDDFYSGKGRRNQYNTSRTHYKKGDVIKVWDPDKKYWDYEIIGDEKWKPSEKYAHITKKMLEQDDYKEWFNENDLSTLEKIQKYKDEIKKEYYNYSNINDLKKHVYMKRYAMLELIENYFFYFIKKYPKKNIYRCNKITAELYVEKPSLERLKYRKEIEVPKEISEISGEHFNIVNYWIFKNAIIFRN
jgi:signal peptidase I